jgi:hypothetical protein
VAVVDRHGQVALELVDWVVLAVEMGGQTQPQGQMEQLTLAAVVVVEIMQQD